MNGGAGFLRRSEVSTELTVQAAPATSSRTRIAAVSFGRRGSDPSNLSFSPSKDESRAAKRTGVVDEVAEGAGSSAASTVQYSTGTNASISLSRSQMILRATVCTRPAERPRQIFFQSRSETS